RYFYSDAMLDVADGLYALTDRRLVLYNADWPTPEAVIAFDEIASIDATWSDDWIWDTQVTVVLDDGEVWMFPLSMENDTDHRFIEELAEAAGVEPPSP
ncbi:MAG: hypothetical protein AAFX76_07845, partial [Planctomycetota bacterium]